MAKLVYDDTGRLLFTKEMKEEYTLLMPQMLPVHFGMMKKLLECEGYKAKWWWHMSLIAALGRQRQVVDL